MSQLIKKFIQLLTCALYLGAFGYPANAANATVQESAVKVAMTFNFFKFVHWPDDNKERNSFALCVLGEDELSNSLNELHDLKIRNRILTVVHHDSHETLSGACDALYVSRSEKRKIKAIMKATENLPTLTIGDFPGFAEHGGMINFFNNSDQIRFEMNPANIQSAGLQASSHLLKLARLIKREA